MALKDLLTLASVVSVIKTIETNDGMGGSTVTTSTTTIPLAALWQNNGSRKFISDKYALTATHVLVFEYGAYTFGTAVTGATIIETVNYNNQNYKLTGFDDDVMNLHEIVTQGLERIS